MKTKILIGLISVGFICGAIFFYNGITISNGISAISPINISKSLICQTMKVTAARSAMNNGIVMVNSQPLEYNVLDKKIFKDLENNMGKTVNIKYEKRKFYFNPCLNSEYIITGITK